MLKFLFVAIASLASASAWAHGMSAEDQARILNAGYLEYIRLGATHMLSGYDHLLFLFGVMFFLTRFSEIIKFITAFTVGHSITLVFATLSGITANYYLIDAVIALTVCYKAFDNLVGFQKHLQMKPLVKDTTFELTEKAARMGFGKLPDNWKLTSATVIMIYKKGSSYFTISVANTTEAKALCVLISSDGEVYDMNFTGEFDGLE